MCSLLQNMPCPHSTSPCKCIGKENGQEKGLCWDTQAFPRSLTPPHNPAGPLISTGRPSPLLGHVEPAISQMGRAGAGPLQTGLYTVSSLPVEHFRYSLTSFLITPGHAWAAVSLAHLGAQQSELRCTRCRQRGGLKTGPVALGEARTSSAPQFLPPGPG